MPTFTLKRIRDIGDNGLFDFYELIVDDVRPMHEFKEKIKDDPKLWDELWDIYVNLKLHAEGMHLPWKDYHLLDNPSQGIQEAEFKSKHIRVFCFKHSIGKIIVMVDFKEPKPKNQENQLTRFRNLKDAYLDSIKQ